VLLVVLLSTLDNLRVRLVLVSAKQAISRTTLKYVQNVRVDALSAGIPKTVLVVSQVSS